jgi:hypothetical protein
MRQDMYKLIVERPRRGGGYRSEIPAPDDLEDSPRQEGLRKRHRSRKWLNENLRPLERFLASQVGRPWDKVYSELCAGIDRRNTVQQHIHQHLEDFVAIKVVEIDGELRASRRWRMHEPLSSSSSAKYYVDPGHGLLLINRLRIETHRDQRRKRQIAHAERHGGVRQDLRIIDPGNQLHRIDGVWYRVEVAPLSVAHMAGKVPIDALRRIPVDQCPTRDDSRKVASNRTLFGRHDVYACSKRQLNARELNHSRLSNDNA